MLDFGEPQDENLSISTSTGDWNLTNNSFVNKIWTIIITMIRWQFTKFIFWGMFVGIFALVLGTSKKDRDLAEKLSVEAARENPIGMYDVFLKDKRPSIKITNNHRLYSSELIKEWEAEYGLKFRDLFQYITFGENKETLIVMKKAAFDIEDKDRTPLKLERSTMVVDSAKNVCNNFLGSVPTDYQKSFYSKMKHFRIRKIEDELTYENDSGAKYFRCVLDEETINELLDE